MNRTRVQAGFGMLEAIVALALFALVGSTLFAWINTNLDAAGRLRERDEARRELQLATAWVQTLNPMTQSGGEAEPEPGLRLRWQARPLTPVTSVAPLPGGRSSPFRVALYAVEVTLERAGRAETRLTLTRLGSVRDASPLPSTPAK